MVVKRKMEAVSKNEEEGYPNGSGPDKLYTVTFSWKNSPAMTVVTFDKTNWDKIEVGATYWYEIKKV